MRQYLKQCKPLVNVVHSIAHLRTQTKTLIFKHMPVWVDAFFLKIWYFRETGRIVDLHDPKGFNDKIQWSKLYDSTPIKTKLADKYEVREWVKETIGEQYLIPLLGMYDNVDDIDFDALPNQFAMKCNHGSGCNIIVKDKTKLDVEAAKKKLRVWMKENFAFKCGFELQYLLIKPKILIEKYMEDSFGELRDYKFLCFNGTPEIVWLDADRFVEHKRNVYDLNWKQLPWRIGAFKPFPSPEKPIILEKMVELVKTLSKGFSAVRVDLYVINQNIYFG